MAGTWHGLPLGPKALLISAEDLRRGRSPSWPSCAPPVWTRRQFSSAQDPASTSGTEVQKAFLAHHPAHGRSAGPDHALRFALIDSQVEVPEEEQVPVARSRWTS